MIDKTAMIQRAEQMVEILSTSYVRKGWHFDTARAAEFLKNVRLGNEKAVIKCAGDHGQSLDWLFLGDPRTGRAAEAQKPKAVAS